MLLFSKITQLMVKPELELWVQWLVCCKKSSLKRSCVSCLCFRANLYNHFCCHPSVIAHCPAVLILRSAMWQAKPPSRTCLTFLWEPQGLWKPLKVGYIPVVMPEIPSFHVFLFLLRSGYFSHPLWVFAVRCFDSGGLAENNSKTTKYCLTEGACFEWPPLTLHIFL